MKPYSKGIALIVGLLLGNPCLADALHLPVVFELAPGDQQTLTPEKVIAECSTIIRQMEPPAAILAKAYATRGMALMRLSKFEEARADFDLLCKLRPGDPDARHQRACALGAMGELATAISELKEIIRLYPRHTRSHITLAHAFLETDNLAEALESANRAISTNPHDSMAYYCRAMVYYRQRKPTKCLQDIDRHIELTPLAPFPDVETPYVLRGIALIWLHRPSDALLNFLMARRLNPSSFYAAEGVWKAYADLGKWSMACQIAQELIQLHPDDPSGHLGAATSFAAIGNYREAIRAAERASPLIANDACAVVVLANVYASAGKYDLALKHYNKALEINPHEPQALLMKASFLSACPEEKYRDGRQACELILQVPTTPEWNQVERLMGLATAKAECGEFDEAVSLAKNALDLAGTQSGIRQEYEKRLKSFQERKAYRMPPAPVPMSNFPDRKLTPDRNNQHVEDSTHVQPTHAPPPRPNR